MDGIEHKQLESASLLQHRQGQGQGTARSSRHDHSMIIAFQVTGVLWGSHAHAHEVKFFKSARGEAEDVQAMLTKSIHEFNQCIKQWTGSLQTQMADANKAGTVAYRLH